MNTSDMMTGVLVVGAIQNQTTAHLGQYTTQPATERKERKTVPVRISVKKHK